MRWALLLLVSCTSAVNAEEYRLIPPNVKLAGPNHNQQLLVIQAANGRAVAFPEGALFTSSDSKIATVTETGEVKAVAVGSVTITAKVGAHSAITSVIVESAPKAGWGFTQHVIPTMTRTGCNSGACHGALAGKGGFKLSLRGFDPDADHFAMTRQAQARRVDATEPANSLLVKKATRKIPHGGATRFEDDTIYYQILKDWIAAGVPGPDTTRTTISHIEVFPPLVQSKPKARFKVTVRATYRDGTQEDVTRFTKFVGTEDSVAGVDDEGHVLVVGPGEAAITAIYSNRVATCTVTVPYPAAKTSTPKPQTNNFLDEHINAKLALLNLPAAGPCSDAEYIRRAYLDTCGILPKPEEVKQFVADQGTDKRAKLVDALLNRPEFIDYWTYRWCDVLLVSSRKLPQPAMWSFYRTVRRAVADNEPWDRFARDILTANGSTLVNGAGNYFVLNKDVSELAEKTAVTFLGMSVNCARCHNHPLEKWTQDQYWAFANLFARVGHKNGDIAGEVIVTGLNAGDALHLRKGIAMAPTPFDGPACPPEADRRAHFATWLTAPDNPFFAKAIVNRIWKAYMGRGLVEAEDDLRETNPPSHPELFTALANDFIANGFDQRKLMKLILLSASYQRASVPLAGSEADDRFYSRYIIRRLPAEVILDAYSDLTNVATPFDLVSVGASGGNAKTTSYPLGTRAMQLPDPQLVSRFLDQFGRPERGQTCSCERSTDASVTQALHLNNGQSLNDKLRGEKSRVKEWVKNKKDQEIVDSLFTNALSRLPTAKESSHCLAMLKEAKTPDDRAAVVEDLFWAVLTSKEFLFNH